MSVLFGLIILYSGSVHAQFEYKYIPLEPDLKKAKALTRALKNQGYRKIRKFKTSDEQIIEYYSDITENLIRQVRNRRIILDDSLKGYLKNILYRLTEKNNLDSNQYLILMSRNQEVNAASIGDGTIIINTGLLAKVKYEEELAFIIAHEISHIELGHMDQVFRSKANLSNIYKPEKHVRKIANGKSSMDGIENIKNWAYILSRYSREKESDADSLGYILFKNAYDNNQAAIQAINTLDSARQAWYPFGKEMFEEFGFNNFPFQNHWLEESIGLYSKEQSQFLFFNLDSISSHPDIDMRRKKLQNIILVDSSASMKEAMTKVHPNKHQILAQFESIQNSIMETNLHEALYYALQLKSVYPKNSYINQIIPFILLEAFKLKRDGMLKSKISRYTVGYSSGMRQVTNFIYNAPTEVIIEMAYHWLNNQTNFDQANQEHFYVLWQICKATDRKKVQERIKEKYLEFHKGGKYSKEMKLPLW